MSTLSTANIESKAANTPPVIKDVNGTECGQFCRAWANFNGAGTVSIRTSFNMASVTDNGTGDYTLTFINAMTDANYCVVCTTNESGNPNRSMVLRDDSAPVSTSVRVGTLRASTGESVDCDINSVAVFR